MTVFVPLPHHLSQHAQDIPAELCSCVNLRHLDVSKNRLLTLPEHFSSLSRITQLNLTGACAEQLVGALGDVLPYTAACCLCVPVDDASC